MIKIIKIYIEGHKYNKDIFELVRAFCYEINIIFLEFENLDLKNEYILSSKLLKTGLNCLSVTKIYYNRKVIGEFIEDIYDVDIPNYDKEKLKKLSIKKGVYNTLSNAFHLELPWGILTGIRPVKVVHNLLDMNIYKDKLLNVLTNEYKFNNSKSQLILRIANSQRKHIYPLDKDKFSLYINIPFCPSKCSYCSFPSFKIENDEKVDRYIDTLIYELESNKLLFKDKILNTIYIGGGTPTSLNNRQLKRMLEKIRHLFPRKIREFTVEAGRPDTIDKEKLQTLKKYGVNRISINPQTFNLKTLQSIGRDHDIRSIKKSYNLAKNIGFDIINMDIILGLPKEGLLELNNTLEEIKKLNPDNLTVHTLSLKKGSKLYKNISRSIEDKRNMEGMLDMVASFASDEGYKPYYMYRQKQILGNLENVGYAKPHKECIYNISMMEEKETVFGFGLGAVTKVYYPKTNKVLRIPNFKSLFDYIERISELIDSKNNINFNEY